MSGRPSGSGGVALDRAARDGGLRVRADPVGIVQPEGPDLGRAGPGRGTATRLGDELQRLDETGPERHERDGRDIWAAATPSAGCSTSPRTDGNNNGNITNYQIAVSTDGTTFTDVAGGTWPGDATAKSATFARTGPVRYVRLTALSGENGFAAAAEINVIGAPAG